MRRAGGGILGFCIVAAMAGAAWLAFRPILNRETIFIRVTRGDRDPSSDAMQNGLWFALQESGHRSGKYRIEFLDASAPINETAGISITMGSVVLLEAKAQERDTGVIFDNDEVPKPLRVLPDLKEVGTAAGTWALESGARRMVLLCDDMSLRSKEIAGGFQERALSPEDRIDAMNGENQPDAKAKREALIDQMIERKPDLIFYSGEEAPYGRAFEFFDALRRKGYSGRLVMGDADPEVSFLAVPTRVVEGTLLISPIGPPSREFAAAYEPATGRHAGPHAWPGYLMMREILQVVEQATSSHAGHLNYLFTHAAKKPRPSALYIAKGGKFEFLQDLK